jgi:predicted ArsR family transcriptional regulator
MGGETPGHELPIYCASLPSGRTLSVLIMEESTTQEQIGDAVGLTAVHVNRTLKSLSNDGLITQSRRGMTFPDWDRLRDEAGFNTRYLHMSQSGEPS